MNLYKYSEAANLPKFFGRQDFIGLKCNYPKDYNDPLELFLTVNAVGQDPELIAYYHDLLGEIPQLPTTCFSKRPDVLPMWAHYGMNHTGFAVELDEVKIANSINLGYFNDIEYSATTGTVDFEGIRYAATTLKPRHTHFIRGDGLKSAYFTKNNCWQYEQERRLVMSEEDAEDISGLRILFLPKDCVSGIFVGARADADTAKLAKHQASKLGCKYYQMHIGKLTFNSFFVDDKNRPHLFTGGEMQEAEEYCEDCLEPGPCDDFKCIWCSLTDDDKDYAARINPLKMLNAYGLGDFYKLQFGGLRPVGKKVIHPQGRP